ncbi:MAG: poly(A) polymerase [Pseudomonadota bacterium]|nr:poly(A) polymerase [Pseudomonadota bacterium]
MVDEVKKKPKLNRDWIDFDAHEIVKKLQRNGFLTYLVGGCVRDLLAGIPPKDFDIATNALPRQVKTFIYNSFIIGRRFRLVLVKRGLKQFEVATFRREVRPDEFPEGVPPGDNIFGSPAEDAQRRDFTVNALFYDPIKDEIVDYCDGLSDIKNRVIRVIGDPNTRMIEDPIRILRALRLAHKLSFTIEPSLRGAMLTNASELTKSALPRRREEILKILRLSDPLMALQEAHDLGLLQHLAPTLDEVFKSPETSQNFSSYMHRFHNIVGDPANPVELFAVLGLAFYRTMIEADPYQVKSIDEILENPLILSLFRDELGLFNLEQKFIAKALHQQPELLKTREKTLDTAPQAESPRPSLVNNESFGVTLLMAYADHLISPSELFFWKKEYEKAIQKLRSRPSSRGRRFSRGPRR